MAKISIGMAKPSQKDIEAAEALCQALNAIDERNYGVLIRLMVAHRSTS